MSYYPICIQVDPEGDCANGSFLVAGILHLMSLPISPHLCSSLLHTHFCLIPCPCLTPSLHPIRYKAGMSRSHRDILEVHFAGEGVQQTEGLFSVNIPNPRLMNGGWCSPGNWAMKVEAHDQYRSLWPFLALLLCVAFLLCVVILCLCMSIILALCLPRPSSIASTHT